MPLAVTGVGLVCSLGRDGATACAAARAGLVRVTDAPDYSVFDPAEDAMAPVPVHAVFGVRLVGQARLLQLARLAWRSLLDTAEHPTEPVGAAITLPASSWRDWNVQVEEAESESDDEPEDEALLTRPPADPWREVDAAEVASWLERVREEESATNGGLPIRFDPRSIRGRSGGPAAFLESLRDAENLLRAGRVRRCLVGTVDSWLDSGTLAALDRFRVLKTPGRPHGFMPGEGAAFFWVELPESAAERTLGRIEAIETRVDSGFRLSGAEPYGVALADAIGGALDASPAPAMTLAPVNGDIWKSKEWGYVRMRLGERLPDEGLTAVAESFGEVGAAAGALALARALHALARESASSVLIAVSGDDGGRGAFRVEKEA